MDRRSWINQYAIWHKTCPTTKKQKKQKIKRVPDGPGHAKLQKKQNKNKNQKGPGQAQLQKNKKSYYRGESGYRHTCGTRIP